MSATRQQAPNTTLRIPTDGDFFDALTLPARLDPLGNHNHGTALIDLSEWSADSFSVEYDSAAEFGEFGTTSMYSVSFFGKRATSRGDVEAWLNQVVPQLLRIRHQLRDNVRLHSIEPDPSEIMKDLDWEAALHRTPADSTVHSYGFVIEDHGVKIEFVVEVTAHSAGAQRSYTARLTVRDYNEEWADYIPNYLK